MATPPYSLALIIKNPSNESEFLLVKQNPPPKFNDPEYDSFLDSPLWDLPSAQLLPLDSPSDNQIVIQVPESCSHELDLTKFDLNSALLKVHYNNSTQLFFYICYLYLLGYWHR